MSYTVIFYYQLNDKAIYIKDSDETNQIFEINMKEINKPENKFHYFRMMGQDYFKDNINLIKYKNDFNREHKEIMTVWLGDAKKRKLFKLDYKKYFNHNDAVIFFFFSTIGKIMDDFDEIKEDEFYILEQCYNAGLITLNLEFKEKKVECFGNDYSRYYTHLLQNMKIPKKAGVKKTLDDINLGKLQFGIYRVKITYTNNKFTNVFNFSKNHHYTASTLNYLNNIKDEFGLNFELLKEDEFYNYNALLYEYNDLIKGEKIFKKWFEHLEKLRNSYPKNSLVKHLMSSLWGSLVSFKKVYLRDISEYDATFLSKNKISEYKILSICDSGDYKCVLSNDAYNYKLARLKPFLTGFGRLNMMKLILNNDLLDNVVRIHTDGIILNKQFNYEDLKLDYYPLPDKKISGLMVFDNAIYGFHCCIKCDNKYKYKDFIYHSC